MARILSTRNSGSKSSVARAFWVTGAGRGEIRSEPLREPGTDDVVVRTRYSAISRGSESLVWAGRIPVSEHERMRAPFQEGSFPAPVKYGYINVGTVESGAPELLGRDVFCLYPHQTRYVVPRSAVFRIPDDVPPARAVLAANLETALNGIWDAELRAGQPVSVIGAGAVGALVAWLARRGFGADVELIDTNPARAEIATALGVAFATPERARADATTLVHASGSAQGLRTALELAAFEGTIIELSWYGDREVSLPLGAAFHSRRLTIRSSQVGAVAKPQRATKTHRQRMAEALGWLTDPALDVLITGESALDELPVVMQTLADARNTATICHRIRYDT